MTDESTHVVKDEDGYWVKIGDGFVEGPYTDESSAHVRAAVIQVDMDTNALLDKHASIEGVTPPNPDQDLFTTGVLISNDEAKMLTMLLVEDRGNHLEDIKAKLAPNGLRLLEQLRERLAREVLGV